MSDSINNAYVKGTRDLFINTVVSTLLFIQKDLLALWVTRDQAGTNKRKRGFSYAIMDREKAPSRLLVDEAINDDNSVITLNPATLMEQLDIFRRDNLLIKGKKRRGTVCTALADDSCDQSKILMNKIVRSNLRVRLGDMVSVQVCPNLRYGKRVHILPLDDTVEGLNGSLFDAYLKPYFKDSSRPVRKGDHYLIRAGMKSVEFKVTETDPA